MAGFVKSLDQKHLVTVGLEGFYGVEKTGSFGVNPGKWAASLGVDFIENSAIDNIDFTSVHAYPHSWLVKQNKFVLNQIHCLIFSCSVNRNTYVFITISLLILLNHVVLQDSRYKFRRESRVSISLG